VPSLKPGKRERERMEIVKTYEREGEGGKG